MTTSLPYVFIPGDNWQDIAMSPEVSQEAGKRVVELMRFFANQPLFTEYLLEGGIGWLDIPFDETGVRLHYRTLARRETRPLIYGLGLFHDSPTRASAGGFIALVSTLDAVLARANLISSFPKGGVFKTQESGAGVAVSSPLSWRDLEGRSETLALADAYRRIAACSVDEGDWQARWEVQCDMPKIIDSVATAFFSPKFPCRNFARSATRVAASPSPNPVPQPHAAPSDPISWEPPRPGAFPMSSMKKWCVLLLLLMTLLFFTSTVIYYRRYAKTVGELEVAEKQRENVLIASEGDRAARIAAETALHQAKNDLKSNSKRHDEYVESTNTKLKIAADKERNQDQKITNLEEVIAANERAIAELRAKADAYDRINSPRQQDR